MVEIVQGEFNQFVRYINSKINSKILGNDDGNKFTVVIMKCKHMVFIYLVIMFVIINTHKFSI